MVYGVHAAGDGFLYFSLLAFHHLILRRDLDNETEISRDDHF